MRYSPLFLTAATAVGMLASCANNDALDFAVAPTDSLAAVSFVNEYDILKSYVDRSASPSFKLGVATTMSSFENQDVVYRIATSNFDEVTPTTGMSHGTVVLADGSIDTASVRTFLQDATTAGMSVYGSTLIANRGQNATWLNTQLDPIAIITGDDDPTSAFCFRATNVMNKMPWEGQAIFDFPQAIDVTPGKTYELELMVKGTVEQYVTPATFTDWSGSDFNAFPVTTSWEKVSCTNVMTNINVLKSLIFNLGNYVGTIYIDDLKIYELDDNGNRSKNLNTVNYNFDDAAQTAASWHTFSWSSEGFTDYGASEPGMGYMSGVTYVDQTDEQKADTLVKEMQRWISGMMQASNGTVKAWNVVGEPLDPENPTELRTGLYNDSQADDEFYWQDYMGRDYAVKAFQYARQAAGSDVKLFINESGLDAADGKLDALLQYVSYIESQSATVDGIGVALHLDLATADITAITSMLQKLAATGKLVRISELDITLGNGTTASAATNAKYEQQAQLYQQIVEAYMTAVPAAQRYGITQWTPVDGSEPAGLWTSTYSRKRAYAGFANGLAGRTVYGSAE